MDTDPTAKPKTEHGDGLLSLYETITNLFTLYSRAHEFEHREEHKEAWEKLADNMLGEVGEFYEIWNLSRQIKNPLHNQHKLSNSCSIIEKRMKRSLGLITPWVSHAKLPHVFTLFENKICKILEKVVDTSQIIAPIVHERINQSQDRKLILSKLNKLYQEEKREFNKAG